MEGLPGWVISPMPGPPPRQHKHGTQYTPSTHSVIPIRRICNDDDDDDGQMIFGDLGGLKFPDICLTGEEKTRKTSPRKLVPTGDRIRARYVTSAHATTCSTAVDCIDRNSCMLRTQIFHWQFLCGPQFGNHWFDGLSKELKMLKLNYKYLPYESSWNRTNL